MAKLFNQGIELDAEREHELFFKGAGMDAIVESVDGVETYHNVTEFHWMYNIEQPHVRVPDQHRVAFESDIHSTGITEDCWRILSVKLEHATKIADDF